MHSDSSRRRIVKGTARNDNLLLPSSSFDASAANRTLRLAWASFCDEASLRAWDCRWCDGGGDDDAAGRPLVDLHAYLHDDRAGTAGYVAVDAARRTVVVSYRGSINVANYRDDAKFWLADPPFGPAASGDGGEGSGSEQRVRVEAGFLRAYLSLRNATGEALQGALRKCEGPEGVGGTARSARVGRRRSCELLFVGHSLGAAMATMAAVDFGASIGPVRLVTFGSPRVGNPAFAHWAHRRILDSHRPGGDPSGIVSLAAPTTAIVGARAAAAGPAGDYSLLPISVRMRRQLDPVPAIPPRYMGFAHLPSEVWNTHDGGGRDDRGGKPDAYVLCDEKRDGEWDGEEDPNCGISEEHPPFPLDMLRLRPAEHIRYMGFEGGNCNDINEQ